MEIAQAVKYYEEQRPSAGVKFWIEFKNLAKRLKTFPELYSRFGKRGIRKAPMHNYPHAVYYRFVADELRILGVVHGAMGGEVGDRKHGLAPEPGRPRVPGVLARPGGGRGALRLRAPPVPRVLGAHALVPAVTARFRGRVLAAGPIRLSHLTGHGVDAPVVMDHRPVSHFLR